MAMDIAMLARGFSPQEGSFWSVLRREGAGWEPPQTSMPYTSMIDDAVRNADDMAETANREWAAGFPARAKAGQSLVGMGVMGSRLSPLKMPEQLRGRMIAASI